MNNKIKKAWSRCLLLTGLVSVMILPFNMTDSILADGQNTIDDIHQDYVLDEIYHAFNVMEEYVIYDEGKNIKFDIKAANDPNVTQLDIDIALDFAEHSNNIINASIGPTGKTNEEHTDNTELRYALEAFEAGKFKALFEETGPAGSTQEIQSASFGVSQIQIVFDASKTIPVHHSAQGTACGGGFEDHHALPPIIPVGDYDTISDAKSSLISRGYHMVDSYASGTYTWDYAKNIAAYGCSDGEMRSQALIRQSGGEYYYNSQSPEPNPEVLGYSWPAYWWGPYVFYWHYIY